LVIFYHNKKIYILKNIIINSENHHLVLNIQNEDRYFVEAISDFIYESLKKFNNKDFSISIDRPILVERTYTNKVINCKKVGE